MLNSLSLWKKRVSRQLIFIAMWTIKISTSPFHEENSLFGEIMAPLTWYNNWWQTRLELPCWKKLTKLVASWIGGMKCVSHLVPPAALHFIYQASIQPYFDYCSTVWGNCGVTLQDKLQKLQNRAARVLFFSNGPFARPSHMVQNYIYWWASCAVGLPKQCNSYQFTWTCLCFGSPTAQLAHQHI